MRHFDLAVIGSGSGNTLVDRRFADWQVAIIDDGQPFGGTCLNHGCIPTKMLVRPADLVRGRREAERLGITWGDPVVDWPAMSKRIFGRLDPLAESGERWRREGRENVTLFRDTARFVGPRTLAVGDETITADQVVLAAGSRPSLPDAVSAAEPALAARIHTSDTIMRIDTLPASLVIVGGGFVACEFAHVFSALGVRVTLVIRSETVLRREDAEIARRYTERLRRTVDLRTGWAFERVVAAPEGAAVEATDADGVRQSAAGELVLIALGRVPNSDRLDVASGGVATDERGFVIVDEFQRTSAAGVWGLGDIVAGWQLKHVANHEARVVSHNLRNPGDMQRADHRFVPHAVFGDPHVASVGLTEAAARERGLDVAIKVQEFADVAFGWAMEDSENCVKLVGDKATGTLVGAHIIGAEASVLIQPLLAMLSFNLPLRGFARGQYWIHPSLSEVVENALLGLEEELGD